MTMKCTDKIPLARFNDWHGILRSTGGRYLSNPAPVGDVVHVYYQAGDYQTLWNRYKQITMPIVETRKDQRWRVMLRRIGFNI